MRALIYYIGIAIVLSSCQESTKTKKQSIDSPAIAAINPNLQPVISTNIKSEKVLRFGIYYFDISDPSFFIDVIDSHYCIIANLIFKYEYNAKTHVISVSEDIENPCTNCNSYLKIFSGAEVISIGSGFAGFDLDRLNQLYHVTSNLNNQSFSIMRLSSYSPETGEYKVDLSNDWLNIYLPLTDGLNTQITSFISKKISSLKTAAQNYESSYFILDSKMNNLKAYNKSKIDSLLSNKVDYNYSSLISEWQTISDNKSKLDNYFGSINNRYSGAELSQPLIFSTLIKYTLLNKKLQNDIDLYSQKINGEVIPLLQQGGINLN